VGNVLKIMECFVLQKFDHILEDEFVENFIQINFLRIQKILDYLNTAYYLADLPKDNQRKCSKVENELYPSFVKMLTPYKTTGNGDCLWNMISISLCGNESLTKLLRLLTVLCLL
jgi:hypothetical protein